MALTKINGDQISTATEALITKLSFLNNTSELVLPGGTTGQRPSSPAIGTIRYNSDEDAAEIYVTNIDGNGTDGWIAVGSGGPSVGNDAIIRTNGTNLSETATIGPTANNDAKFSNGFSVGPITIDTLVVLTIETNSRYIIF
tara:strand:+ start:495 stop:920 length:426 start_codon:yes stop_codon:yes gene_type:complete